MELETTGVEVLKGLRAWNWLCSIRRDVPSKACGTDLLKRACATGSAATDLRDDKRSLFDRPIEQVQDCFVWSSDLRASGRLCHGTQPPFLATYREDDSPHVSDFQVGRTDPWLIMGLHCCADMMPSP